MKGPARMGGGKMFRAVGRTVGAGLGGVQEAVSTSGGLSRQAKPVGVVSVLASSSSPSSSSSFAASLSERINFQQAYPYFGDADGWEDIGEEEIGEDDAYGFPPRLIFGPVPTGEEVADAVSTIQQTFAPFLFPLDFEDHFSSEIAGSKREKALLGDSGHFLSSSESESDWIEPALHLCYRTGADSLAHEKVIHAFRLLRTNPAVKRTVVSLSSDKAVWDAVMSNEAVQELRESFRAAEKFEDYSDDEEQNLLAKVLGFFNGTKEKMMELVEKMAKIIGGLFPAKEKGESSDLFEEALKSSFMLSVVVFIVVMIARSVRA